MIAKTTGIVLRVAHYSKTSHVVTWITPDVGKLITVVKGALRPKSPFLGQYDLYYTCELLYYARTSGTVHITKECTPISVRERFRSDWRAAACASYVCDLITRISPGKGHQPELYGLTGMALDFMAENGIRPQYLLWFELTLAGVLGFSPQLDRCAICAGELTAGTRLLFSHADGGAICTGCTASAHSPGMRITPDILAMLRRWQSADSWRAAWNTRCSPEQLRDALRMLGGFLEYHLEADGAGISRRAALELMEWPESA
jgi:DNA repair protein RecO (recombination protein O)